jgi:hypothetical protein
MRSHILVHGATTKFCDNPFIFKNEIEKEGLPRDSTPDMVEQDPSGDQPISATQSAEISKAYLQKLGYTFHA